MMRSTLSLATFLVPVAVAHSDSESALLWLLAAGVTFSLIRPLKTGQQLLSAFLTGAALSVAGYLAVEHQPHGLPGLSGAAAVAIGVLSRLAIVARLMLLETPWLANLLQGKPLNTPWDTEYTPTHLVQNSTSDSKWSSRDAATVLIFFAASAIIAVPFATGRHPSLMVEITAALFALFLLSGAPPLKDALSKLTPRCRWAPHLAASTIILIVGTVWVTRVNGM